MLILLSMYVCLVLEAKSIKTTQIVLNKQSLYADFQYIQSNFILIVKYVRKLETYGFSQQESFD